MLIGEQNFLRMGLDKIIKISARFVDRDMIMRYHWGKGIGHKYAWEGEAVLHDPSAISTSATTSLALEEGRTQARLPMEASCQGQADEDEMVDMEGRKAADEMGEDDTLGELGEGGLGDLQIDDGMEDRENEDLGEEWSDEDLESGCESDGDGL